MQTILKKLHTHPMSNEKKVVIPYDLIHDKNLSYRALGFLTNLLSRPDKSNLDEFIKSKKMITKEGRLKDKFIKVMEELEKFGYLAIRSDKFKNSYLIVSTQPMTIDEINAVKLKN